MPELEPAESLQRDDDSKGNITALCFAIAAVIVAAGMVL